MAKKPFNINSFLSKSPEEQAKVIEKETARLISRLPSLKKNLQMYNEVSDEMYNLNAEEVDLQGRTWASAVRKGQITTETSKGAYNKFIKNLHKYARPNIHQLALESATQRLDSWLDTLKQHASQAEVDYATELLNSMTDDQKIGFTRSNYFIDNSNWNSKESYVKDTSDGEFSMQTLELELYLQKNTDITTRNIYNSEVATDGKLDKVRRGVRKRKKGS